MDFGTPLGKFQKQCKRRMSMSILSIVKSDLIPPILVVFTEISHTSKLISNLLLNEKRNGMGMRISYHHMPHANHSLNVKRKQFNGSPKK